jgi:hypothetical protein
LNPNGEDVGEYEQYEPVTPAQSDGDVMGVDEEDEYY